MYFTDGRLYKYAQIEQFCFFRPRVFNMTWLPCNVWFTYEKEEKNVRKKKSYFLQPKKKAQLAPL